MYCLMLIINCELWRFWYCMLIFGVLCTRGIGYMGLCLGRIRKSSLEVGSWSVVVIVEVANSLGFWREID
jgi:hypothetical protein